jgi:hypothetical protein
MGIVVRAVTCLKHHAPECYPGTQEDGLVSKRQNQAPLPTPAWTEKDSAHLHWIRQNSSQFVRGALTRYRTSGRGAFIIREEDAKPSGTAAHYLTVTAGHMTGNIWPNATTAEMVRTYDPTQQFIIVFVYRNGAASPYTIRFSNMGDTFTVEAV